MKPMKIEEHIKNLFIAPDKSNLNIIEETIALFVTQMLDYLSNANSSAPLPLFRKLPSEEFSIPAQGMDISAIQSKLNTLYQNSMNPANSRYLGHMDSIPTVYSILGEMIASAINNNMLSLEMSPYLTQLEHHLIQQFTQLFELSPETSGGIIVSGGSLANLQALVVARNQALNVKDTGLCFNAQIPVIFTSEASHASVVKSAMIMGIGINNVTKIKCNHKYQMDLEDLQDKIKFHLAKGHVPIAIVATAGTTVTGSIDSLPEIAEIAQKNQIWLHVDAIYGGALIFLPEHKQRLKGIEFADSISFNPQKWLYVAKTCSMLLFKNYPAMVDNFRISAPYMKEQTDFINLGEITIQGSRNAEVLKLWLSLLSIGTDGYRQLINHGYNLSHKFTRLVAKLAFIELITEPETNVICFRIKAEDTNQQEQLNIALQEYLLKHGVFVSVPRFNGQIWLRMVLLNPFTDENIIEELCRYLQTFYDECDT
ncbi:MAG: aminotransferase class I/II-fold pyridoxal phosphate-dependent enzyme [Neisseriaceae bacterium]|nr:MAG: aminotransferase class I/II-fold pyridoxal phosphate-dependent enzyme [Neisseriaceae bacterium]